MSMISVSSFSTMAFEIMTIRLNCAVVPHTGNVIYCTSLGEQGETNEFVTPVSFHNYMYKGRGGRLFG